MRDPDIERLLAGCRTLPPGSYRHWGVKTSVGTTPAPWSVRLERTSHREGKCEF
jgi:hypothetical protein